MERTLRKILSVIVVVSAAASFASPARAEQAAEAVRIGLILPLTGAHAETATAMKNAALLSYANLTPGQKEKIQLVFEDDELSGAKAVTAFNKLTTRDSISAAITFGGQSVAAVAPLADQKRVPTIALTADSSLVSGHPFVMQHWLSSAEQARAVFAAVDRTSIDKVALVSTTHNAALDILRRFETLAQERGFEIAYKADFSPNQTDFRTDITKLKATKPEAILGVFVLPHMALFAKQLRALNTPIPMFCSANAETAAEVKAAGGAMEGIVYAGPDLDPSFVKTYENSFGSYPEFAAPHIYDAVQLFALAIQRGAYNGEQINKTLREEQKFSGVMGQYRLEGGFRFGVKAITKQIRNGRFERWRPMDKHQVVPDVGDAGPGE